MLSQADLSTTGVCDDALQLRLALWFKNASLMKGETKTHKTGENYETFGASGTGQNMKTTRWLGVK